MRKTDDEKRTRDGLNSLKVFLFITVIALLSRLSCDYLRWRWMLQVACPKWSMCIVWTLTMKHWSLFLRTNLTSYRLSWRTIWWRSYNFNEIFSWFIICSLWTKKMTFFFTSLSLDLYMISVKMLVLLHIIKNISCYSNLSKAHFDHFLLSYYCSTFLWPTFHSILIEMFLFFTE
jgi:hypothetical protein